MRLHQHIPRCLQDGFTKLSTEHLSVTHNEVVEIKKHPKEYAEEQMHGLLDHCNLVQTSIPLDRNLQRIVEAVAFFDPVILESHLSSVAHLVFLISNGIKESYKLNLSDLKRLYRTAKIHDIGKIFCGATTLQNRRLSDDEFDLVALHPIWSYLILANSLTTAQLEEKFFPEGILFHHWKTRKYPSKEILEKSDINYDPMKNEKFTDLTTVCDVFDALVHRKICSGRVHSLSITEAFITLRKECPEIDSVLIDTLEEELVQIVALTERKGLTLSNIEYPELDRLIENSLRTTLTKHKLIH